MTEKWPPLNPGTRIKTTVPNKKKRHEWTDEAWEGKQSGSEGKIITHHDSHGLCYLVRHADGSLAYYDPEEFVVL